jgi:hypothetical protein
LALVLSVFLFTDIQAAPNYSDGIQKAIAWFDANRCGTGVATNNVFSSWRGNCHTSDAVNGGFHDAGDHVKFQQPAAFAASCIGWSIYEFKSTWPAAALTKAQQELQIFCDYALAAWNGSTMVVQIGDAGSDHSYWGAPENQTTSRPSYRNASADILGQTAASLALMYINFGGTNYLNAAKAMYNVAKSNPASQSTVADGFYTSGGSYDDMTWASIWLYYATNDSSYLTNATSWIEQKNDTGDNPYQKQWTYCWDDSALANTVMMYRLTGDVKYYNGLLWNFDWYTKNLTKTPYGLPYLNNWAVLRYDSAEAGLMYVCYKEFGINYNTAANMMIDYCFGTNPKSLSYLTNTTYTSNSVKHPHHRANEPVQGGATHGMVGALAGGPDNSDNFTDDVNQYQYTEVALDYNASFLLGCVGRKYVADGGAPGKTPGTGSTPTPGNVTTPTPVRTATPIRTATPRRTITPRVTVTPTPVRTATPGQATPTPTSGSGSIKVQFYNQSTAATTNQLYLNIKVVNTGSSAVALSNVKVRYYYTINGAQTQNFYCDYAPVGSSNLTSTFVTMGAPKTGADTYVEVGFTSGAGSLAAGGNTTVQARVAKSNWTNYTQTDDYSFNSTGTTFVDWTKVAGYVSGALQWGVEP